MYICWLLMYTSTLQKNWVQIVVYMSKERNWFFVRRLFLFCFCLFFVFLFYFFGIVCFVTTTPDKFQFQSQVRLSRINVIVPIRLKFKLYAVFIEWSSRIDFLFMGRQDIVNYWDFLSKFSRHCHKRLVPKIVRHDQREMFVKKSLRDWLICFVDFVGMTLLAVLFLLPSPNCFFRVCFPTLFAAVLKFFLPLKTSAISDTANSNKAAPTRFAVGTIYLRKNGIAVFPITYASALKPQPRCRPTPL